jgi:hypothetical protein
MAKITPLHFINIVNYNTGVYGCQEYFLGRGRGEARSCEAVKKIRELNGTNFSGCGFKDARARDRLSGINSQSAVE